MSGPGPYNEQCRDPCPACSGHCSVMDHKYLHVDEHSHVQTYGSASRSGTKLMVTVRHSWRQVPTLEYEPRRLAP